MPFINIIIMINNNIAEIARIDGAADGSSRMDQVPLYNGIFEMKAVAGEIWNLFLISCAINMR